MSDQPAPPAPPGPPPLAYRAPMAAPPAGDAQRVFDTVTGPNLRARDNLIQLACVVVGAAAGGGVGWFMGGNQSDAAVYVGGGVVAGLVGSLLLSGLVIGILRGVGAARRR